ncbi:hypothetical protein DSECCO2_630920 [anaerobic digester metagenome]
MKKLLFVSVIFLLPFLVNAQEMQTRSYKAPGEKVMAFLMGSGETTRSEFVYTFENRLEMDYSVVITPLSENTLLYVSKKTENGFIIKTTDGKEATFDFVVFVRKESYKPASE